MQSPPESKSPQKLYSPVAVQESPSCTQRNLTGIARQIKDISADLYNCIQKWNEHHLAGIPVINKIRDYKFDAIEKKDKGLFPEGLQEECKLLDHLYHEMSVVLNGIQLVVTQFQALKKLQDMKDNSEPVFLTWTMGHFVEVSTNIGQCYEKELELKKHIKENIAFSDVKNNIEFYRIAWLYQPCIDEELEFKLESLLKETGHK